MLKIKVTCHEDIEGEWKYNSILF